MTKGFVTPMVVGLAVVFLCWSTRSWRWVWSLRPGLGAVIVAAPLVPWVWAVAEYKAGSGGLAAYAGEVWREFFVRGVAGSKEGHFWPPGMHTVALAVLFWPGSLMTLAGFVRAWRRAFGTPSQREGAGSGRIAALRDAMTKAWRGRAAELFLIAWIVPAWVVFELSPAKLLHYTMPMLPAVALVSARMVCKSASQSTAIRGVAVWWIIGLAPAAAALLVVFSAFGPSGTVQAAALWAVPAMIGIALLIRSAYALIGEQRIVAAQLLSVLGAGACLAVSMVVIAPEFAPGSKTPLLVQQLRRAGWTESAPLGSTYREDSIVFATRGAAVRLNDEEVGPWLAGHVSGVVLVRRGAAGVGRVAELQPSSKEEFMEIADWVVVERAP